MSDTVTASVCWKAYGHIQTSLLLTTRRTPSKSQIESVRPVRSARTTAAVENGIRSMSITPPEQQVQTFGIEFEACLVYHEDVLQTILQDHQINHHAIVKGHPTAFDEQFQDSQLHDATVASQDCRMHYPSWTLAVSADGELTAQFDHVASNRGSFYRQDPNAAEQKQRVRKLYMEHLLIAKKALQSQSLPVSVVGTIGTHDSLPLPTQGSERDRLVSRSADYTHWTLTNDFTLTGCLPSQIIASVKQVNDENIQRFDSHGLELITPVFQFDQFDASFDTIHEYIDAITNGQICHTMPSVWAGMHVHIGVASDADNIESRKRSENFIRALLFLLLVHEDLITKCFPRSRSGEQAVSPCRDVEETTALDDISPEELERQWEEETEREQAEQARQDALTPAEKEADHLTNELRDIRENERLVLEAEARLTNATEVQSNARHFAAEHSLAYPLDPNTVWKIVFDPSNSAQRLLETYQSVRERKTADDRRIRSLNRGFMYNFSNLYEHMYTEPGEDGQRQKPTIEFRQHECCVEAETAKKWVRFLEALTEKASSIGHGALKPVPDGRHISSWVNSVRG
ncbi:uncharacterized protein AB675_3422 [Cyphellophora attinorum]|uniref:Uncharacterized protein n=1 Tax=Cyphellophora attinorum TaxID=1664694 RepID=A0A0N1HPR1_9EURO|nr:uncharacterized protein AB675_3422 [Phialophora attinorum]KPI39772.1 hypothetical protein AB675_3422 [Phialophora attinorum]